MEISPDNINLIYDKYGVSESRRSHSLGVAKIAAELAKVHGINPDKAWLAGALHDIAREWNREQLHRYCEENDIVLNDDEKQNYKLIHGKVSASLADSEFGIHDQDIVSAIRNHTVGHPNMSPLEEIIYISDFLESTASNKEYQNIRDGLAGPLGNTVARINTASQKYLQALGLKITDDFLETQKYYSKYLK